MSQDAAALLLTDLVSPRTAARRVRLPVLRASGGDHPTIYYFLQSVFQGPSRAEFHASLEDPFYEPYDRLLLRRERHIVAHVHLTHRTMQFGETSIPAAGLAWLGVAIEHRGQSLGPHLLRAAESQIEASGSLVGMLRTSIPYFFRRTGWALCGPTSCRRANARALLARLLDRGLIPKPRRRLHIRPWLQWEQAALARIYSQNMKEASGETLLDEPAVAPACLQSHALTGCYGPLERTDAYWHWLLNRQACDQIYVALEGPEQLELGEISTRIVGYAVTRGEQILELMAAPDRPRAAAELLARCCGDAIELDRHCVLLHAPPGCPLFELFDEAATLKRTVPFSSTTASPRCPRQLGQSPPEHGEVSMMRLFDPLGLLRRLCSQFERRAVEAGLPRPLDLGLLVEGQKYQLELGREGIGVTSQRVGRSYLRLNVADFTRLVLGQLDWDAAVADDRLECSTALARNAGRVLFPSLPLWRPPWDEMPTIVP